MLKRNGRPRGLKMPRCGLTSGTRSPSINEASRDRSHSRGRRRAPSTAGRGRTLPALWRRRALPASPTLAARSSSSGISRPVATVPGRARRRHAVVPLWLQHDRARHLRWANGRRPSRPRRREATWHSHGRLHAEGLADRGRPTTRPRRDLRARGSRDGGLSRADGAERARLGRYGGVRRCPVARLHVDGEPVPAARQALPHGPARQRSRERAPIGSAHGLPSMASGHSTSPATAPARRRASRHS